MKQFACSCIIARCVKVQCFAHLKLCQTDSVSQVRFGESLWALWGHDSGLAVCASSLRSSRSKSLWEWTSPASLAPGHMPQSHLPLS